MNFNILNFIKSCVKQQKINWTYHVNMRLKGRFILRKAILNSVDTFEIIEKYKNDKYLPSYLIYAEYENRPIHIQIATDLENENITIITAYNPTLEKWGKNFKTRRQL